MESIRQLTKEEEYIKLAIKNGLRGFNTGDDDPRTLNFIPPVLNKTENSSKLPYKAVTPIRKTAINGVSMKSEEESSKENEKDLSKNERQRNTNTSEFPQSVHGVVLVQKSENEPSQWGSGFLIGPDLVLTAARNVYDDEKPMRNRHSQIKFIPGANGDEAPYGEIEVIHVFAPENYINHKSEDEKEGANADDIALLVLKKPIGRETGYVGLHFILPMTSNFNGSIDTFVAGYPADPNKETNEGNFEQWVEKVKIREFDLAKGLIQYQNTVVSTGQAGSGVIYKDPENQLYYVIGVHISETSACLLDKKKSQEIVDWIDEARSKKLEEILQGRDDDGCVKIMGLAKMPIGMAGMNLLVRCGLSALEQLNLSYCRLDEKVIEVLSNNSNWPNLQGISLANNFFGNSACQHLGSAKGWKSLRAFILRMNQIEESGLRELLRNDTWADLEEIDLAGNLVKGGGAALLAAKETWKSLKAISLAQNLIGDEGAIGIGKNEFWKNLENLLLANNEIGNEGARTIAANTSWSNLKVLHLFSNKIGEEGGKAIGENTFWKKLETLELSKNSIGDKGAIAIGNNTAWENLKFLGLASNGISDEGGVTIGRNASWKELEYLDLSTNQIGNKSAVAIASNPTWSCLKELHLHHNKITDEGFIAIGRNTIWKQLFRVRWDGNEIGWKGAISIGHNPTWTGARALILPGLKKETKEKTNALKLCPHWRSGAMKMMSNSQAWF